MRGEYYAKSQIGIPQFCTAYYYEVDYYEVPQPGLRNFLISGSRKIRQEAYFFEIFPKKSRAV